MKKEDLRLDTLFSQVLTYRKSEHFNSFMHRIAGLTKLSPYNAMLVYMQRPGAGAVATASQWRALGAELKEGANPLVILRPFGPVEFVFEEGDLNPETKPKELASIFEIKKGEVSTKELYRFTENLQGRGINVNFAVQGVDCAGYVTATNGSQHLYYHFGKVLYKLQCTSNIVINGNLSDAEKFATLIHEVAHIFCGHTGDRYNSQMTGCDRKSLPKNEKEFEAESVCWLITQRRGIDNPSHKYLAHYLDNNDCIPEGISIETILCVAGRIEQGLEIRQKPLASIVISKTQRE